MIGYIYKTTNLLNNKIYIGKHEASEFEPHKYIGSGKILREQIQQFGKENFSCELIDQADTIDELNEKEKYWIKVYDSQNPEVGYNILDGGNGCHGYNFTLEVRKKMSVSCTNNNLKRDKLVYEKVSSHHTGSKMMNDGKEQKWVYKNDIETYLNSGWEFGSCKKRNRVYETGADWKKIHANDRRKNRNRNRVWVHKDNSKKFIEKKDLPEYLSNSWKLGMKD